MICYTNGCSVWGIANKALQMLQKIADPRKSPWGIPGNVYVIYNVMFAPRKCKDVEIFPDIDLREDTCSHSMSI